MQYKHRRCLRAWVSLLRLSKSRVIGATSRHSIDVRLSPFLDHPRQSVRLEGVELGRSLRHRVLPRRIALFSAGRDVVTSAWCSIPDQAQRAVVVARQRHASNILPATQTPPTLAGYNTAADGLAICRRHDRLPESPLTSDGRVSLGGETKVPNTRGSFGSPHCRAAGFARLDVVCAMDDVRSERKSMATAI